MTIASPPDTPWTLDEFVEQLNAHVPLDSTQDARRAPAWNPRLVRHYTTSKALSAPEKQGRQAFYGPQHLDEARRLTSLQNAGVSAKSVAMLASSVEANASVERPKDPRQRALSLLSDWQGAGGHTQPAPVVPTGLSWNAQTPPALNLTSFGLDDLHPSVQDPVLTTSTQAMASATEEQWHRWSPLPGLDIALREDLWGREDELRHLLTTWAKAR